jgi:hypothetical protein
MTKTIVYDLETVTPCTLSGVTTGIHPPQLHDYQQTLFQQFSRGFRAGEMMIISSGRQTGKSSFYMKMLKNRIYDSNLCKEIILPTKPMKEEKYKFSRAKWYQAEFNDKDYFEVRAWCSQQFGPDPARPDAWSRWWHKFHNSILFRDEKDYILFTLRWS